MVVGLFSILSLGIFATFASGMRLWSRIQEATYSKRKALLFLERVSLELRQALVLRRIGFSGKAQEVSFPILSSEGEIIKVTYSFIEDSLFRTQEGLQGILEESGEDESLKIKNMFSDIEELNFSFAYKEEGKEKYSWKNTWSSEEGIPKFVKIELKTKDGEFFKTVKIPVS